MSGEWTWHSDDLTIAYDDHQGREIVLGTFNYVWKVILYHKAGVRRTVGIWAKDKQAGYADVILFNASYGDGQEIVIPEHYADIQLAVNFARDEPPKNQRWHIQGAWYRQAFHYAEVTVKKYYRTP